MSSNIYLKAFIKENSITQDVVANFLGVSRGFIGMVCSGKNKLSDTHLEKLFTCSEYGKNWKIYSLCPIYTRLLKIEDYLNHVYHETIFSEENKLGYIEPFERKQIQYGKKDVDKDFARFIGQKYPELSAEWIISGEGSMLTSNNPINESKNLEQEIKELKNHLSAMAKIINSICLTIENK